MPEDKDTASREEVAGLYKRLDAMQTAFFAKIDTLNEKLNVVQVVHVRQDNMEKDLTQLQRDQRKQADTLITLRQEARDANAATNSKYDYWVNFGKGAYAVLAMLAACLLAVGIAIINHLH